MKTLSLEGWQLDYYTGLALGYPMLISNDGAGPAYRKVDQKLAFEPHINLNHCEPVMHRMTTIMRGMKEQGAWCARAAVEGAQYGHGATIPEACCLAFCLAVHGPEVPALGSYVDEDGGFSDAEPAGVDDLFG